MEEKIIEMSVHVEKDMLLQLSILCRLKSSNMIDDAFDFKLGGYSNTANEYFQGAEKWEMLADEMMRIYEQRVKE